METSSQDDKISLLKTEETPVRALFDAGQLGACEAVSGKHLFEFYTSGKGA